MYTCVCLAISHGDVVVSLYLVSLIFVFTKLLPVSLLSLQLKCKATWVFHKYMLQQCTLLSKSVNINSVTKGLNSTVHSGETAISMNKQGVVHLYVPLLSRDPFPVL